MLRFFKLVERSCHRSTTIEDTVGSCAWLIKVFISSISCVITVNIISILEIVVKTVYHCLA